MNEKKIKEAIIALSDLIGLMPSIDRSAICHLETAIEALEKQLPMKPINTRDIFHVYKCSKCKRVLGIAMTYCPECGQKLGWLK